MSQESVVQYGVSSRGVPQAGPENVTRIVFVC